MRSRQRPPYPADCAAVLRITTDEVQHLNLEAFKEGEGSRGKHVQFAKRGLTGKTVLVSLQACLKPNPRPFMFHAAEVTVSLPARASRICKEK